MKRALIVILLFALLALDWAALDDITTGNEPDYYGEYAILLGSIVVFAAIGWIQLNRKRSPRIQPHPAHPPKP